MHHLPVMSQIQYRNTKKNIYKYNVKIQNIEIQCRNTKKYRNTKIYKCTKNIQRHIQIEQEMKMCTSSRKVTNTMYKYKQIHKHNIEIQNNEIKE